MAVRMLPGGKWTYPTVVAPTSGGSADPAIAADDKGNVYVAWMDATSGEWAIQLGVWDGRYWTSYPAYYARGKSPALTMMADGALFLAWQDRIPLGGDMYGKSDIFVSERKDRFWTLPVNVSDNQTWRPGSDSLGVALSTATGRTCTSCLDRRQQPGSLSLRPHRVLARARGCRPRALRHPRPERAFGR